MSPPALQVPQEFEERLLHDVLGVLMVPDEDQHESVHRRSVLLEQGLRGLAHVSGDFHSFSHRYNAPRPCL